MKTSIRIVLLIFGLQLASPHASSAQKMIRVDEDLKLNSLQLQAKRKGISSVGKYEFGPYRVISGKGGWEKSSSRSPFFSDNSSVRSSVTKSFVFVNDKTDTAFASISIAENVDIDEGSWIIRTLTPWSDAEVKTGEGIFECALSFSADTVPWDLVVIYPVMAEVDGIYQADDHTEFRGILTDEHTLIDITEVHVDENGKNSMLNPVLGYEFWLDSKCLAAVQVLPANRWYVWMRNNLEPDLEFLLASAITAMLIRLM